MPRSDASSAVPFLGSGCSTAWLTVMACARPPTPDEASTLRTNSNALTRVATDPTGRVVETVLPVFPGDRVDAVFTTHHVTEERQTQA